MRAREFTINIPINIKINDDGVEVSNDDTEEPNDDDVGVFVPPLQQEIELLKKNAGVKSVYDEDHPQNNSEDNEDSEDAVAYKQEK